MVANVGVWMLTQEGASAQEGSAFVSFEGQSFEAVFSNLGHIQILTSVPDGFENNPAPITFDLDNPGITVIPEPSSSLLLIGGSALLFLRRRRS